MIVFPSNDLRDGISFIEKESPCQQAKAILDNPNLSAKNEK
jgi:hypothetical protein